jgi:hypothetical protein
MLACVRRLNGLRGFSPMVTLVKRCAYSGFDGMRGRFQQQLQQLVKGQIQPVNEFKADLRQYSDALKAEPFMQADTVAVQDVNSINHRTHVVLFGCCNQCPHEYVYI